METKKVWRREGAEFFQRRGRKGSGRDEGPGWIADGGGSSQDGGGHATR